MEVVGMVADMASSSGKGVRYVRSLSYESLLQKEATKQRLKMVKSKV